MLNKHLITGIGVVLVLGATAFLHDLTLKASEPSVKASAPVQKVNASDKSPQSSEQAKISLDPSTSNGSISPYLYGANHIYINEASGTWDPQKQQVKGNFDAVFQKSGITMLRYPGGTIGNTFRWKEAIGPVSKRLPQVIFTGSPPQVPDYGLDEGLSYMTSRNVQPIYVYNWANGSAADAADLVEYLNAPNDGSNPNGGTDWAAVRAKNGHPEPYHVHYFEIGNEVGLKEQMYWTDPKIAKPIDPATGQPYTANVPNKSDLYAHGGTVAFTKQPVVEYSDWRNDPKGVQTALSDGKGNQVKYANFPPVMAGTDAVYVGADRWSKTSDLSKAGPHDNVYTLDDSTGKMTFGDGVHGSIPPKGQPISISYQSRHDGYDQYYAAIKKVDPSIRIYSSDGSDAFIQAMGTTHPYDGMDRHLYAYDIPNGLTADDYHDRVMADLDKKNTTFLALKQKMLSTVGPEKAVHMDFISTEFGILSANNFPGLGNKYLGSLDNAIYTAVTIMNRMDAHTLIAMRHKLSTVNSTDDGLYVLYSASNQVLTTPSAMVYQMFSQMFGNEMINPSVIGNPIRTISTGAKFSMLQVVASRDSSGNVYVAVANKDRATNVPATIAIAHDRVSGKASVWSLDSANYSDYNDGSNPNKITIQKTTVPASATFEYSFPAHSLTFIKFPGKIG